MYRTGFWNGHSIYLVKNCFAILIRVSKFVSVEKFTLAILRCLHTVHVMDVKAQPHKARLMVKLKKQNS